jgi:hypothetical protein
MDAKRCVGADPPRSKSGIVVGVGVVDVLGLSDQPLAAGEFEDIEVLHGNR